MINRILRQLSVQKRITAAFALLALALILSLPLLIYNYNFLVSRITDGTANDRAIDRLYLTAAITIMDSRLEVKSFLLGIEPDTQDAAQDVDEAIAMINAANKLSHSDGHRMDTGSLINNLFLYKGLIESLDNSINNNREQDKNGQVYSGTIDQIYLLSSSLTGSLETLVSESNQHLVKANIRLKDETSKQIAWLIGSYISVLFVCFAMAIVIGQSITRPIYELQRWAKSFQQGHVDTAIPLAGNDELTTLARVFNKLAQQLATSNSALEQKVTESVDQIVNVSERLEQESVIRRQIEIELQAQERQYQTMLERASDGIVIFQDEKIRYVNPRMAKIIGYQVQEMIETDMFGYFSPDAQNSVRENYQRHLESGGDSLTQYEAVMLTKAGKRIDIEINEGLMSYQGRPATLAIIRDISERMAAQERLRQSEEQLQTILDNLPIPISISHDSSKRLLYVNQAYCQLMGGSPSDYIGQETVNFYTKFKSPKHEIPAPDKYHEVRGLEVNLRKPGGSDFWAAISTYRTTYFNETANLCAIHDLSSQKHAEELLSEAKEAAEAASHAKSQFLSNMTHELRTPMNGVLGMTSILLDTKLNSEQLDIVNTIRMSGDTLLGTINEILDFSKLDADKVELEVVSFDLRACIEESLDLVSPLAVPKALNLVYFLEKGTPRWIRQDVTRVRQILANLLGNAVKFTQAGEIIVSVKWESLADGQSKAIFAVQDTGIGIPADRTDRLFHSFSQVDASTTRRFGGTGLGLVISKRLAEAMGGTMWVESNEGVGSTFFFSIITEESKEDANQDELESNLLKDKTVLIVTESKSIQRLIMQQLESWQVSASSVEDIDDSIIKREKPDILIIDYNPLKTKTPQTLDKVVARHPAVPIVFLTDLGLEKPHIAQAKQRLAITKPVRSSQLLDALVTVLHVGSSEPRTKPPTSDSLQSIEAQHRHPLRILLAEDNLVNQKVALGILKRYGYRADVAANGLEVLTALRRQDYELILMDISMPEMDGMTAMQVIRDEWPSKQQPYIIALTANAMPGDRENYLEAGMNDYLSKPLRSEALLKALEGVTVVDISGSEKSALLTSTTTAPKKLV